MWIEDLTGLDLCIRELATDEALCVEDSVDLRWVLVCVSHAVRTLVLTHRVHSDLVLCGVSDETLGVCAIVSKAHRESKSEG
jgi:hypothetical protein